jgi:hypothetical protein
MTQNRRNFIKSSAAVTFLTVSKASAQAVTRTIGIFHSTQLDDEALNCFKAGLGLPNIFANIRNFGEAKGRYGGSHGHDELRGYLHGHPVDLIVAAGGVASQMSASEELASVPIPFVYLSGRAPTQPSSTDNGKYCGVILNTSGQYSNALTNPNPPSFANLGIAASDVWLIQNYNSDMTPGELADWGYNKYSFRFFESSSPIDNPNPNNPPAVQTAFANEWARFARLYSGMKPKGVIVSSDPYFRLTAHLFKAAMKNALGNSIPISYPFKDFNPSSPDFLLPNGAILSSTTTTDPNTAYYKLGKQAAAALDGLSPGNPIPTNSIPSLKWDGSNWAKA